MPRKLFISDEERKAYHREARRKYRASNPEKYRKYAREYAKKRYRSHPEIREKVLAYGKAYHERNREKSAFLMWKRKIRRKYGMTLEEYDEMSLKQGGVCALCNGTNKSGIRLSVDHRHGSHEVRGLLCDTCNRQVIGRMEHRFSPGTFSFINMILYIGKQGYIPKSYKEAV
jgi:hypothetical protein